MIKIYYRSQDVRQIGVGRNKRWSFDCHDCGTEVGFGQIGQVADCVGCGETYTLDRNRPATKDKAYAYLLTKARVGASFRGFSIEDRADWTDLVEEHGTGSTRQWIDYWFGEYRRGPQLAYAVLNSLRKHGTFTDFGSKSKPKGPRPGDFIPDEE